MAPVQWPHLVRGTTKAGLILGATLALLVAAVPASAGTFKVTTTKDRAGACATKCSLRAAVLAAGETTEDDLIKLKRGKYRLTRKGKGEDAGLTGDLDIAEETSGQQSAGALEILGRGRGKTKINARRIDRVVHLVNETVGTGPEVVLKKLTITGGRAADDGTGIRADSERILILRQVVVGGNRATEPDVDGGGIENRGSLTLDRSTVRNNQASGDGGGISMNSGGPLFIERSTIAGNQAGGSGVGGDGGAIYAPGFAISTILNSTISGNEARGPSSQGGGIYLAGELNLNNTTVAFNDTGNDAAGGIYVISGADLNLRDSIVAKNQGAPGGENCAGSPSDFDSFGNSLENLNTCHLTTPGDLPNASPKLKPLDDNGGPTQTHALRNGSDAIDSASIDCPPKDQRGVTRPQGDDCDIGALELKQ
jgi:CSLREA domain-containing protein